MEDIVSSFLYDICKHFIRFISTICHQNA